MSRAMKVSLFDTARADRPAGHPPNLLRAVSGCCESTPVEATRTRRRARLAELESHLHCSIIGTCLSTGELRRLMTRFIHLGPETSDLEIHHSAVKLAGEGGDAAKAMHKALDDRYAGAVRRLSGCRDETALREGWQALLAEGDVPGGYWALHTHADVTAELRQYVFGEVHMLSHLVGASNRADIRKLRELEVENHELKDKVTRQQDRLRHMSVDHELELRALTERSLRVAAVTAAAKADANTQSVLSASAIGSTRSADTVSRHLLQRQRHEALRDRCREQGQRIETQQAELDQLRALLATSRGEAAALEQMLQSRHAAADQQVAIDDYIRGRKLLYVGGRPSTHATIRSVVEAAGGRVVIHDGGIEDRKGLLESALSGADLVVFPVDCIDHDSMSRLKRLCERNGVAWHPLRSSGLASFSGLLAELAVRSAGAGAGTTVRQTEGSH